MKLSPTSDGGRLLRGDTDTGRVSVQFDRRADGRPLRLVDDANNVVGTATIEFRSPEVNEATRRRAEANAAICRACEQKPRVMLTINGWPSYTVTGCKAPGGCDCGGISLIHGSCPLNKWKP